MKKLFLFLFLACGALQMNAQSLYINTVDYDTLTNADTVLNIIPGRDYAMYYEVLIDVTAISGTTLDTIYIEQAAWKPQGAGFPTDWHVLASHPVSTASSTWQAIKSGNCGPGRLRIRSKSTGTQSTAIKTATQIWRKPT